MLIDYSDRYHKEIQPYHDKVIALDIEESLFIIHDMRVRGFHPFHDTRPEVHVDDAIN